MDFFLGTLYNKLNTVRGEVYSMPEQLPEVTAIVVAAGASRRMGFDKLSYRLPDGQTVLEKAVPPWHPTRL